MLFSKLVEAELPVELHPATDKLLAMKQQMPELGDALRIKELDEFIEKELESIKCAADEEESIKFDWESLNRFFCAQIMGEQV